MYLYAKSYSVSVHDDEDVIIGFIYRARQEAVNVLYNLTLKTASIKNSHFGRKALQCNQLWGTLGFLHSIKGLMWIAE